MNDRQRTLAVLNYHPYDRLPVVHFGFWHETLRKWAEEGHLTGDEADSWGDGNPTDAVISRKLGFDFNYYSCFHPNPNLLPAFESKVIRELPDGGTHVLSGLGVVELHQPGAGSIPAEVDYLFKDRSSWEELFKPRLQFAADRVEKSLVRVNGTMVPFDQGGREFLKNDERDYLYGLHCGSLYGTMRSMVGMENLCYLASDDEDLYTEVIDTMAELCYQGVKYALETGAKFDFAHFWEDICFKNGPLVAPAVFMKKVGPHYRRITELVRAHGIAIVSLDCDGLIDALIPTWFENGVNTMFPIEVGTWNASLAPWRTKYGRGLRGVGGMNKVVFALNRAEIDAEIERLKPLVALGGFIPCPDHRLAPDAKWDNVRYYCDRMQAIFS